MMKKLCSFLLIFLASCSICLAQRSYASIFRSWGFIGDSLCSGEMECFVPGCPDVQYIDLYEYSWGQQLCRLCGSEGWNFSHGGQTARGWLGEMEGERGWGYAKEHPKQAYIIAMGVNDFCGNWEEPKNAFAADMEQIIINVKSVQPRAKFFVLTRPRTCAEGNDYDTWNEVVRNLADRQENVYIIDMYNDAPVQDEEFAGKYYLNGHLSAAGYLWTAYYLMDSIDRIIRENPEDFKDVPLIGTELLKYRQE